MQIVCLLFDGLEVEIVETLGEGGGEADAWEEVDEWLIMMVWSLEGTGFVFGVLVSVEDIFISVLF